MHRFPTRQSMFSQISMRVSWYCRNFPSEETNQYLEPRCLLEHEETKNERKKQTKRETKFASVEGKPLSIHAANLRTAAVGIQDLGIPVQPDKPTKQGQQQDHIQWHITHFPLSFIPYHPLPAWRPFEMVVMKYYENIW